MKASKLFERTYNLCQKWHLREFTRLEALVDFSNEFSELIEAIVKRETKEEIGHEWGDVIFTIIRHHKGEDVGIIRKSIFFLLPKKHWLDKKLDILDARHDWWMKKHNIHAIRNYANLEKRQKIIDRHNGVIPKNTWIK